MGSVFSIRFQKRTIWPDRNYAVQYAQYGTVRFVRSTLRTTREVVNCGCELLRYPIQGTGRNTDGRKYDPKYEI
jgi:hypothetical protein